MNKQSACLDLTFKRIFFLFAIVVCSLNITIGQKSVSQRSLIENWKFKEEGTLKWLPAKVPGCVHTDLLDNGIIKDPFYRLNESEVQWVDKKDWVYQNYFKITSEELYAANNELIFEGVDTYSRVYLNDSLILQSNNMNR